MPACLPCVLLLLVLFMHAVTSTGAAPSSAGAAAISSAGAAAVSPSDDRQAQALAAIYHGTGGTNWVVAAGWMQSELSVCNWYGVTCDNAGNISVLDLHSNGLAGQLPLELADVQARSVRLGSNRISGTLPPVNSQLISLTAENNSISGTLTSKFQAIQVREILLDLNPMSGTIGAVYFSAMPDLAVFSCPWNISGTIPPFKVSQNNLLWNLGLSHCEISGTIPPSVYDLPKLSLWFLTTVHLSGTLSSAIGRLTSLYQFTVAAAQTMNKFSGTLPKEISGLTTMGFMGVYENAFSGTLPEMEQLQRFTMLAVSSNFLSGTIGPSILRMSCLEDLYLQSNQVQST